VKDGVGNVDDELKVMARLQKLAPELLYLIFRGLPLPDLAALECVLPAFAPIFKDIAVHKYPPIWSTVKHLRSAKSTAERSNSLRI